MSTELKTRSKGYELTRNGLPNGAVGVTVRNGSVNVPLNRADIETMFATDNWQWLDTLNLLDETLALLKVDLAEFQLTDGGKGMESV